MLDTDFHRDEITRTLIEELRSEGIVRRYPSSDFRRESLKKLVIDACNPVDRPYVDQIVAILSDSANRAVETIWSERVLHELESRHSKTQRLFPTFMRLDFQEVASNLTINWLEAKEDESLDSKTRKHGLDVISYKYCRDKSFIGWLNKVWLSQCRDIGRKKSRIRAKESRVHVPIDILCSIACQSDCALEEKELIRVVLFRAKLNTKESLVLDLKNAGGQTSADIARELGCSTQLINKIYRRATQKCQRILKQINCR